MLCLHILQSMNTKNVFVLRIAIFQMLINTVIQTILEYILQTLIFLFLANADIWTSRTDNMKMRYWIILIRVMKDEKNQVCITCHHMFPAWVCLSHAVMSLDLGQREKGKTLMIQVGPYPSSHNSKSL